MNVSSLSASEEAGSDRPSSDVARTAVKPKPARPPPLAPLILVLPPSVPNRPFHTYEEEGLVQTRRLPEEGESCADGACPSSNYATVEVAVHDACACGSRDGMVVAEDGSAFFCRDETSHLGHGAFRLPSYDPGEASTKTAMLWLLCNHFKFCTFRTRVVKGVGLERKLVEATEKLFSCRPVVKGGDGEKQKCGCVKYRLKKQVEPIFFLKKCVVSAHGKGPTIECVVKKPSE